MHRLGLTFLCAGLLGGCFAEPVDLVGVDETPGTTTGPGDDNIESTFTTGSSPTSAGVTSGAESSGTTAAPDDSATSTTGEDPTGESSSSDGGQESSSSGPPPDCAGVPGGDAELDACGVCNGPGGPCWGCTVPAASNYDPLAEINDGTCTCNPGGGGITDQSNLFSDAGSGSDDQWQSFTAGVGGGLTRIDLGVGSPISGPSPGTIRVYEGEGLGGTQLGSQDVTFEDVHNQVQEFPLDEPVPLIAGQVYTIRFSVPNITVGWVDVAPDVYAGGRSSFGVGTDFVFRTVMAQCIPD